MYDHPQCFLCTPCAVMWPVKGEVQSPQHNVHPLWERGALSELPITHEQIEWSFIIHHESQAKPKTIIYLIHAENPVLFQTVC